MRCGVAGKVKSKCYGCKERYPGCHDKCEDYRAWKSAIDAENEKIRAEKKDYEDFGDYQYRAAKRLRK